MSSTFSGISTALSSLRAQRQGLDVAGQNIANANTEGYTRQRVEMNAVGGVTAVPTIWAKQDTIGSGVQVGDVNRIRDELLESRVRNEHAHNAYLSGQDDAYTNIQDVFKEPSDTGLQERMSTFWSDWQDLSNNPGDGAARTKVMQPWLSASTNWQTRSSTSCTLVIAREGSLLEPSMRSTRLRRRSASSMMTLV